MKADLALLRPMLASAPTRGVTPAGLAGDDAWSFEEKLDGVRVLLSWDGTRLRMFSRTTRDLAPQFPEIRADLDAHAGATAFVLDGELRLFGQHDGGLHLSNLLARVNSNAPRGGLVANEALVRVFDILSYNGVQRMYLPLSARRELLHEVLAVREFSHVNRVRPYTDKLRDFEAGRNAGLEGVIAKRLDSLYLPGRRVSSWVKFKHRYELTCIVYGVTPSPSKARRFGAIEVAVLSDTKPLPIGTVGSGLSEVEMRKVSTELDAGRFPLVRISCMGRTAGGLREPVFEGFCLDGDYDQAHDGQLDTIPSF